MNYINNKSLKMIATTVWFLVFLSFLFRGIVSINLFRELPNQLSVFNTFFNNYQSQIHEEMDQFEKDMIESDKKFDKSSKEFNEYFDKQMMERLKFFGYTEKELRTGKKDPEPEKPKEKSFAEIQKEWDDEMVESYRKGNELSIDEYVKWLNAKNERIKKKIAEQEHQKELEKERQKELQKLNEGKSHD